MCRMIWREIRKQNNKRREGEGNGTQNKIYLCKPCCHHLLKSSQKIEPKSVLKNQKQIIPEGSNCTTRGH